MKAICVSNMHEYFFKVYHVLSCQVDFVLAFHVWPGCSLLEMYSGMSWGGDGGGFHTLYVISEFPASLLTDEFTKYV